MNYGAIIIGSGHDGLVTAFYLARAGLRVLVLEARDAIGGSCVTEELIPGFKFSACANVLWALRAKIRADMRLFERGLTVDQRQFLRLLPSGEYMYTGRLSSAAPGEDAAYREAAGRAASQGELPDETIIAGFLPSVYDPTLAPPGGYTWSAYITWAPAQLRHGSWIERKEEAAARLLGVIERYAPNFRRALLDYVLLTPADLETRMALTDGNIHHVDAIPSQMLWQRPLEELAHYRTPIARLYLCGTGMHRWGEGSGAPGYNAAHAVLSGYGEPGSERR